MKQPKKIKKNIKGIKIRKEKIKFPLFSSDRILYIEYPKFHSKKLHQYLKNELKKDKYYMISLICGIWKNDTNELIYKTETDSDSENKFLVTKGKMFGEW